MIESLAEHGVQPMDLVPALMTTHTIANPEFDPAAKRKHDAEQAAAAFDDTADITSTAAPATPTTPQPPSTPKAFQTTTRVLGDTSAAAMPGVSTSLSAVDERVTLDIRWTVLCDLFLLLVADSVYDARSRVLLEQLALKMGLGWLDVTKFERRVTDALEMQEGVERLDQADIVAGRQQSSKKRRYVMMGLATLGEPRPRAHAAPPVDSASALAQAAGSSSASPRASSRRSSVRESAQRWAPSASPARQPSSAGRAGRPSSQRAACSPARASQPRAWPAGRNLSRRLTSCRCTTTSG
jgi:hypothetical protein